MDHEDALIGAVAGGRYAFKRCLAQGRTARIYEAAHGILSSRCVVKVMRPDWIGDEAARQRFLQEAKHLARVRHPAVVRVLELTSLDGSPSTNPLMIVLERIEGVTVEELLWEGPLPIDWATTIAGEVAHCLHAAHLIGIVHGGLRASEVMLTGVRRSRPIEGPLRPGSVKILDWGDSQDLSGQAALGPARAVEQRTIGKLLWQMLHGIAGAGLAPENMPPAALQNVVHRATAPRDEDQFPSLEALAQALSKTPRKGGADDEVALRFCPRCGSQDLDTRSYNSPWTAACLACGATFSMMTMPIGRRV